MVTAVCLSCFVFTDSIAQTNKDTCVGKQDSILHKFVYNKVDEAPEPEGGLDKMGDVLMKNIKLPQDSSFYAGSAIVVFVIEPNGTIDGKRITRDSSGDKQLLGKHVLDIISKIKWKPAKCNGQPVPCLYALPVHIN
jgi:hypothetical protein